MIYLTRVTVVDGKPAHDIAALEDKAKLEWYTDQGYTKATPAQFRASWRARDLEATMQLFERMVNEY
jgi:hypothetical protein